MEQLANIGSNIGYESGDVGESNGAESVGSMTTSERSEVLTAEAVATAIRTMIREGRLVPGERLRQEPLAELFGVSRIPVREALRRLQAEGRVLHHLHQGYKVAPIESGSEIGFFRRISEKTTRPREERIMEVQIPSGEQTLSADAVTEALRSLILSGQLGIGVQLKQQALAERFGVSRIPVREALKQLQAEGLIEHRPHHGSVVASQSVEELLEALDIRIALETRALKLAIPAMQPSDHRELKQIMARYDGSESPQEWSDLNLEFHMALYRPCNRPRLLKMIEESVRGISRHMRAMQSYKVGRKAPQTEHALILKACVAKDVPLAVQLLEAHIEHTQIALRS